jgi:hypothetical protein
MDQFFQTTHKISATASQLGRPNWCAAYCKLFSTGCFSDRLMHLEGGVA